MCMRDIIIDLHRSDTLIGVRGGACMRITVMCYLKSGYQITNCGQLPLCFKQIYV